MNSFVENYLAFSILLFGAEETISKQEYFRMLRNAKRTSNKTKDKIETILNKNFKKKLVEKE